MGLSVTLLVVGCGDDNDVSGDMDDGAGNGSTDTPDAGSGTDTGDTTTGGDTGTTTPPATTDPLAGLPMGATCDSTVPTTATCGGTACPAAGMFAAFTCTVPCCVDDACGTMTAVEGNVSDCMLPPEEDTSCPHYEGNVMGMAIDLPGCCNDQNVCGVISTLSMSCITSSMFLTDLEPGPACGDDADGDGGI